MGIAIISATSRHRSPTLTHPSRQNSAFSKISLISSGLITPIAEVTMIAKPTTATRLL